jgi:hypothetical protein
MYEAEDIINWHYSIVNGHLVLDLLVLRERYQETRGTFGSRTRQRYRVFRWEKGIVTWETYIKNINDTPAVGERTLVREDGGVVVGQDMIPFSVCYCGKRRGELYTIPPLLELAFTNISHWQVQSDLRHSLHIASVPIPVFKNRDRSQDVMQVGAQIGIDLMGDGDAKYLEHTGSAVGAARQERLDLEERMMMYGLHMLRREFRQAETARSRVIDKNEQDSMLSLAARSLQDCLENALDFHAKYLGEAEGGDIKVNDDYIQLSLDATAIAAIQGLYVAGTISLDTLWTMLTEGNVLPEDFDPEEEKKKLLRQAPPGVGPQLGGGAPAGTTPPPGATPAAIGGGA